ncbi:hypothetical protein T01_4062 [Trichinella spiralis]|uniref:Uncharacterized protein n=1 Tax=Trichinella spiralis TaxID=6334 RepID=A0A0V1AMS8_TRISP|nr:hypothetical protein T01_4062 [Trichinella spiralis]
MLDGLFSLTPNMIARHGVFQSLDGVSFSSRQPLYPNETRLMTMNLLFRVPIFNCSMVSFRSRFTSLLGPEFSNRSTESLLAHASRYLQTRLV